MRKTLLVMTVVLAMTVWASASVVFSVSDLSQNTFSPMSVGEEQGSAPLILLNGELVNLNDLLPPGSTWELLQALTANHFGQVTGMGLLDGEIRPFQLSIAGDGNGDGRVNSADRRIWLMNYDPLGQNVNGAWTGDWNGDGRVNSADRRIWLMNYNPLGYEASFDLYEIQQVPVDMPEPSSLILLVGSVGFVGRRVWKKLARK